EQQLHIETQKHQIRKDELVKTLNGISEGIRAINQTLDQIKKDIAAFEKFTLTDSWMAIDDIHKQIKDKNKTTKGAAELIMELIQTDATAGNR
ncbi:hypothetical protein ACO1ND_13850, partial [Staphylococcus aureus]